MLCSSCGSAVNPGDRFCAHCGESVEQRCATCGTVLPEGARFCPACGSATALADDAPDAPSGEERKIVSVLFADLVGFTRSGDGIDPEDLRRRLQPFHTAIRQVVESFGGRIEKLMGDGVLAVFGAPTVHEDDPERAVRAGLQIHDRIAGLADGGLTARIAIGTGEAVVLVEGTTMDREGLVGDVVNTASRLQAEADPGTVLVDETTHRATFRAVRYEERAPVAVKGKAQPLAVWVAVEPVARFGADIDDESASFVGRRSELALLVDAFDRAGGDSTSQLVTIAGEPGVGKSRLVRELRRHIDELPDLIRWRQGRCLPYGEGVTYWALGEIVKAEAGILETDTPATALGKLGASLEPLLLDQDQRTWVGGRLAPLVGSDQESAADRSERFAAWHRYLAALGEQRPTVVVIEDLHWADPNLIDFISEVPGATRGTPLLLVCTARPDFFENHPTWGAGQRNSLTIHLDPLDAEATEALLDELLAEESLEPDQHQLVLERSGGNPLWAQEFVRMLRDRTGDDELAIPDSVQAVVASRVDLLEADTKVVLQAASTVGKSFWRGIVSELIEDVSEIDAALQELARRELVRRERISTVAGEPEYAFTHSVVRDVAYGQAPRPVRALRHHKVARWIERMAGDRVADRAEVIAHHDAEALRLATATDLPDVTHYAEAALSSHRRASDQAARLDLGAQRMHLEAALELAPEGHEHRGHILADLGDCYRDLGMADAAEKTLLEASDELDRAGDLDAWGIVQASLAAAAWTAGERDGSDRYLTVATERLEREPPGRALAVLYSRQAGSLWLRGDAVEDTLALVERVRAVVEAHGDREARGRLLTAEGGARFDAGDPSAVDSFRRALRMAIEADATLGIGSGYLNLGEQLRTGWGLEEAISVHARGLEVALQRHNRGVEQFLRFGLVQDYYLSARWGDCDHQIEVFFTQPDRLGYIEGGFSAIRELLRVFRGETTGLAEINRIVEVAEGLQDLQAIVPSHGSAAWISWMLGDQESAVEHAREVVIRSGPSRFLIDEWSAPLWLLRQAGELERIRELVPDLGRFDMPRPHAQLAWFAALEQEESDPPAAVAGLEKAAQALSDLGVRSEAVVALAEAARIAQSAGLEGRVAEIRPRGRALLAGTDAEPFLEKLGL